MRYDECITTKPLSSLIPRKPSFMTNSRGNMRYDECITTKPLSSLIPRIPSFTTNSRGKPLSLNLCFLVVYILWMAHSLWDSWPLLRDNLSCWNRRLLGCTLSSSSWLLSSRRFEDSLFLLVLAVQFEASLAIGLFRINIEIIRLSLLLSNK